MHIGNIDLTREVMVVAEIGNNHEGDFGRAQEMIAAAAEAGAHAVKFQTITPDRLVSAKDTSRLEQLRRFQFSAKQFTDLAQDAKSAGVYFLSTPFDTNTVSWLDPLVVAFKIASGDNNYNALLEATAKTGKPIILSTGAATFAEITESKRIIDGVWANSGHQPALVLLHCVVSYPTELSEANLSAISELARLKSVIGYSDHTIGVEAAVLSVAMGARVIEKHFTLDKNFSDFRDHQLSADPKDFALLMERIREAQQIIGFGGKKIMDCERDARNTVRRSLHIATDLPANSVLTANDITCVRPANGLPPSAQTQITGRKINKALTAGAPITEQDLC